MHSFEGRCIITGKDINKSKFRRHIDQGGHDEEDEDM